MTIGSNIKQIRQQLGLSQGRLSDISGVPQTTISTIERGATPNVNITNRIAKALHVSMEELLPKEVTK